jgi:hypothetical protein
MESLVNAGREIKETGGAQVRRRKEPSFHTDDMIV